MADAFGIDKRDYTVAHDKWEKRRKVANTVENTGASAAGGAGAVLALGALRDAAVKDHPKLKPKLARVAGKLGPRASKLAVSGKPGLKVLGVGVTGGAVGAVGSRARKISEKKVERYSVNKVMKEPGSLMHQGDLEIAKGMLAPDPNKNSIKQHKKVQGALGTTAAVTGLTAAASKTGAKMLPKVLPSLTKTGKAGAYQKHLDKTADALLYGASAIGGASGIHQSRIYAAEGKMGKQPKKKELFKAYDPERARKRRLVAYEGAAGAGAVGTGTALVRNLGRGRKVSPKIAAAGVGSAALGAGIHVHRKRGGKPYSGPLGYQATMPKKTHRPNAPLEGEAFKSGEQRRLLPTRAEQHLDADAVERRRRRTA